MSRFLFEKESCMDYQILIKKLRNSLIVSQVELANMLGVSYSTVNRWEKEHHEPTIKAKRRIVQLCKDNNIGLENLKNGK